jgi:hypothetical protein
VVGARTHSTTGGPSAETPGGVPGYKTPSGAPSPMGRSISACSLPSRGEVEPKAKRGRTRPLMSGWSWTRLCSAQLESEGGAPRRGTRRWKSNNEGQQENEGADRRGAGGNRR